jgi:FkbM family methyltransferase
MKKKIITLAVILFKYIQAFGFIRGFFQFFRMRVLKSNYIRIYSESKNFWIRRNKCDLTLFECIILNEEYNIPLAPDFNAQYIVDAGANIGLFSLYMNNRFPHARIYAYEPDSENFEVLKYNLSSTKNIFLFQEGIWDKSCYIESVNASAAKWEVSFVENYQNNGIKTSTINGIMEQNSIEIIDIIKIDVEGAEKCIFSNNIEWVKKSKIIIVETHDRYFPDCSKTVFKAFEDINYELEIQSDFLIFYNLDIS